MARLFVAVWPSPDAVSALEELPRKPRPRVRWVAPEQWHVTLRFLGECHPDDVVAALEGLELPAALTRLGPATDVLGERSLVVPAEGLDELAEVVRRATREIGERSPRRRFIGHLTVARLQRGARLDGLVGRLVGAEFDVGEIALVESRLRPEGARYETVHTWAVS